jgi:arsenite methyltransferase
MGKPQEKQIKEAVKKYYAECAQAEPSSCCAPESCSEPAREVAEKVGYSAQEVCCLPQEAEGNFLGCGNPLAFSEIQEGEVVLDIGSGAGMDVILAAQKVGEQGKVIGLDMTPEMIERARKNAQKAGVQGIAEFRLGEMENMPIDDESIDLIISNCVINLSPDKTRTFQEAHRVLRPDGRMLVSDLVSSNLPEELRNDLSSWAQCLGGTVEESEYLGLIREAGFEDVAVVNKADATAFMLGADCCGTPAERSSPAKIYSIDVRAVKASSGNR